MTRQKKSRKTGPLAQPHSEKVRESKAAAQDARKKKKQKHRKGNQAGSRHGESVSSTPSSAGKQSQAADPRVGSKKPIVLKAAQPKPAVPHHEPVKAKAKAPRPVKAEQPVHLPESEAVLEKELAQLEQDAHLNTLLERLDEGQSLLQEEQDYVDQKMARHQQLMKALGLDETENEEESDLLAQFEDADSLLDQFKQ